MDWKILVGAPLIAAAASCSLGRFTGIAPNADVREQQPRGTLISTAAMQVSRAAHTATALTDGRVLVAGGFIEEASPQGAEVYEPGAGQFAPLPPMVTRRHSHTATLLPNGKVLIAGGYGAGAATLAAAELFDPATNSFSPTGSLLTARANHVAIPLASGKVLIAGGEGSGWTFLASAELYDPFTGRFSSTGSLTTPRGGHAGVRLPDGRVLIVGGHNGQRRNLTILASAEIYDPATGMFTRAGAMGVPRHKHDAVLLSNGPVLITGGSDDRDDRGIYNSTELFDWKTGVFIPGPAMRLGRFKHRGASVVLPSGLALIAGGAPQAEIYDAASRSFAIVPGQPRMAGSFSAVAPLKDGGVLIAGGYGNGAGPRSSAWLYRP